MTSSPVPTRIIHSGGAPVWWQSHTWIWKLIIFT